MTQKTAVFWSYAHEDDRLDHGRVLLLATHLKEEFSLLTGDELDMFVDRDGIGWGDNWRTKIDDALTSSTFFIPVLTPRYFKREECRRELLTFYGQAESRGLLKLMLPMYYLAVPIFSADSQDKLVALTARSQYEDWRALRLKDVASAEYRAGVHRLASKLVELRSEVRQIEIEASEAADQSSDAVEPGLVDALQVIESLLPDWVTIVEEDPVSVAQFEAIVATYQRRLQRDRSKQLAIHQRMAMDLLPLARAQRDEAKSYSAATIALHPHVTAVIRGVRASPEHLGVLGPLRDAVAFAKEEIDRSEARLQRGEISTADYFEPMAKLGGTFRELVDTERESNRYRNEGNAIVVAWSNELESLVAEATTAIEETGPL